MLDLDALSREIAATSPDWAVLGVEAVDGQGRIVRVTGRAFSPHDRRVYPSCVFPFEPERDVRVSECRPDLNDDATVNALLEYGQVWFDGTKWMAALYDIPASGATRTEAICRAWIAAKGRK